MPPNPIDIKTAAQVVTLVSFEYGATPTVVRYAAWPEDVEWDSVTWQALPALLVEYGKQDGTMQDAPAQITMASAMEPLVQMRSTFPPVAVVVRELDVSDPDSCRITWKGRISRITYNYNGNAGVCRFMVTGHKQNADSTISLLVGRFCPWSFGKGPCTQDLSLIEAAVNIVSVEGQKVTVTGLTHTDDEGRWKNGEVMVDGFPISVQLHKVGEQILYLCKAAPMYWVGRSGVATPGGDKTLENCCQRWGQTAVFGAMGRRIPNREVRSEP